MSDRRPGLPPAKELLKLRETQSVAAIARALGLRYSTVYGAIYRAVMGLPSERRRPKTLEAHYEKREDGHWIWLYENPDRRAVWTATHGAAPPEPLDRCPEESACVNPAHVLFRKEGRQARLEAAVAAAQCLAAEVDGETEVAKARRLREAGVKMAVIARALGRSREWVYSHVAASPTLSETAQERAALCLALRKRGLGLAKIAQKTGIAKASVSRLLAMIAARAAG